jgi:hypothetical protein
MVAVTLSFKPKTKGGIDVKRPIYTPFFSKAIPPDEE